MNNSNSTDDLTKVASAVGHIRRGGFAIIIDEQTDTGDLVLAATRISADGINTLATHARGLTELALSPARIAALGLPPMSAWWDAPSKPFTVSIEARRGVTTGISARDRAETVRVAVSPHTRPGDLVSPGHVFPLRAPARRLADARTRTVAALSLARLAGCGEGAVLSQILDDAGELARGPVLRALAHRLGTACIGIDELAAYEHLICAHGPAASGSDEKAADTPPLKSLPPLSTASFGV
jgi:3,4-dihydroxy 2-butanone 4-phosphate synthase/GTP cyclohydrolase II